MRIREPFAQERSSEERTYKSKYFIASEGQVTEPKYFEKLNQSLLSENVTIINILRDYTARGNSNPTYVVALFREFIQNNNGLISVLEIKNRITNWDYENPNKIKLNEVIQRLSDIYNLDEDYVSYNELEDLFMKLFKSDVYKDLAENFSFYFLLQGVTYSPTTDFLNIVVDRDKDSFTESQYDEVVRFCKDNNVNLYVSNPNFEFWLYLHFSEVEVEDREKLLENPKVGTKKRYIEKKLNEICGYTKTNFSFDKFEKNVRAAIEREKMFTENIEDIKDNLGTNVGKLVASIINSV